MNFVNFQKYAFSFKTSKDTQGIEEVTPAKVNACCNFVFLSDRAKLGHGLLSGQYAKPPMKSELIEQVMKEEHKVLNWVCPAHQQACFDSSVAKYVHLGFQQSFSS